MSATDAASRLFRAYEQHCRSPSPDALFQTLTAMHSLSERLQKATGQDFHGIEEFIALKALRNLAHHHDEVRANVRILPSPALSDLAFVCIVRRDQVERAIDTTDKRWRKSTRAACQSKFHWYGLAVNINPCLFNFMVHAFEMLTEQNIKPAADAIASFEASYEYETEEGHSHYVDGKLVAHAGDMERVLSAVAAQLPTP
jgi:hypothetical protein